MEQVALLLCSSSLGSWALCFLLLFFELAAAAPWRGCLAGLGSPSPSSAAFHWHWGASAELGSPPTRAVGTQDRPAAAQALLRVWPGCGEMLPRAGTAAQGCVGRSEGIIE